jgi:hypothetical protein
MQHWLWSQAVYGGDEELNTEKAIRRISETEEKAVLVWECHTMTACT